MEGLYLTGNYLRGVSVRDCLTHGLRLAERIVNRSRRGESDGAIPVSDGVSVVGVSR
jgi:hypothetical protein